MSDVLPENIVKVIAGFLPVISRMSAKKRSDLISGILQMQKYGVEAFANRIIYPNGYSSMFCTSVNWKKMDRDKNFQKDFINHTSFELVNLFKNRNNIISRSGDKTYNKFLSKLEDAGVNNSIITNEFYDDRIEIIYYMADPAKPENRDVILNNLELLSFIRKVMKPALHEIFKSEEFKINQELLLNPSATEILWNKGINTHKDINLFLDNKEINLTSREVQCLVFLRFGSSNQFIADNLKISVETVKHHLNNLKTKLSISDKKELIKISQDKSIIDITKAMGLI